MRKSLASWTLLSCLCAFSFGACDESASESSAAGSGGEAGSSGGSESGGEGGSGGLGGAGGETPASGGLGTGGSVTASYPPTLRESGLYADDEETLAPGVREFSPRFHLYSDGAAKRRFIYLPPGTKIDTSDPDYWVFPAGTKFWKEFSRGGVRVETRYLEKRDNGKYWRIAYHWNEQQTDAVAVPDGVVNASGTEHDIPSRQQCSDCHSQVEGEILGFSALQLAYDSELLDAADLVAEDLVSDSIATTLTLPGDAQDQAALGYLHVNCGTCHNPTSAVQARVDMDLRLRVGTLGSLGETPAALTTFGVAISVNDGAQPDAALRITAGSADDSAVYLRMHSRGELYSMPPLGTELVDADGSDLLKAWIDSLP